MNAPDKPIATAAIAATAVDATAAATPCRIAETADALAPQAAIAIALEGQPRFVPAGSSLADLVAALGHPQQAVSTAVNEQFVPRGMRGTRLLQAGDSVMLFQPIVGG
jgi:sulfur carrier protein